MNLDSVLKHNFIPERKRTRKILIKCVHLLVWKNYRLQIISVDFWSHEEDEGKKISSIESNIKIVAQFPRLPPFIVSSVCLRTERERERDRVGEHGQMEHHCRGDRKKGRVNYNSYREFGLRTFDLMRYDLFLERVIQAKITLPVTPFLTDTNCTFLFKHMTRTHTTHVKVDQPSLLTNV